MKKLLITIGILLVIVCAMLWFVKRDKNEVTQDVAGEKVEQFEGIKMTFLDIGQGDATFIEFDNGQQMLVDCSEDARVLEALGRVMSYYDHDIDYMVVTHPDSDHFGGCEDVLNRFDVRHIVHTGFEKNNDSQWDAFLSAKDLESGDHIEINKEDVWNIGSSSLHFLYPDHSLSGDSKIPGLNKESNNNNTSIIFELSYGGYSVLMMGDAEEPLEKYLLSIYGDQLDSDILKLGHHGSDSSSIQEFINVVTPLHAIASAGVSNKFGHPSRRVLKRLERASSTVWRTDQQGDIEFGIGINGIEIS